MPRTRETGFLRPNLFAQLVDQLGGALGDLVADVRDPGGDVGLRAKNGFAHRRRVMQGGRRSAEGKRGDAKLHDAT